jgi:hypothetical protein
LQKAECCDRIPFPGQPPPARDKSFSSGEGRLAETDEQR